QDIFFRQGEYQPGSHGGQALLAHELTHVIQQNSGTQVSPAPNQGAILQPKCSLCSKGEEEEQSRSTLQPKPYTNGVAPNPVGSGGSPIRIPSSFALTNADALTLQPSLLGDAAAAVGDWVDSAIDTAGEVVDGIANWIDLLGPKRDLMAHMVDSSWIIDQVTATEEQNEANPDHAFWLKTKLYGVGANVAAEAMAFVLRIRDCGDRAQVDALREAFDAWKTERATSLQAELDEVVENYREIERSWLQKFAESTTTKDNVNPNQSAQSVALTLKGGVPSATVIVETRVNCTFQRTAQALQDNDGDGNPDVGDWTDDEKNHFMNQFQQQLDDVWSTGASDAAPFRCTAPQDYLLSNESPKWSEVTANMKAQVTADASNPHFKLNVFKESAQETQSGSNRAFVNTGGGNFYLRNADAGYQTSGPDAGRPTGAQHTLAHEWHHMIGNPDEYAENSASQSGSASTPASLQNRWSNCQQHFQDIITDSDSTPEEKNQARQDLQALQNHARDMDPSTPGFQAGIFPLAGRSDIPDECFAIRGSWAPGPTHITLRPGAQSQRGGTHISASAADAARLSDRGNEVRPYMREGIVQELQSMLAGQFSPEVNFDHNFQEMTGEEVAETVTARIQNILHDISDLGASQAPGGDGEVAPDDHHGHDH
ncbi:MAG: DUF4157 domain-containing protein, partial [Leptolyngbyaceae bacterium]|nr:DUF4157 domain-containing protein [Leptolyngbyaceae bacterium]